MHKEGKALVLVLNSRDNVATALQDLSRGTVLRVGGNMGRTVTVSEKIPFGHKIALCDIAAGSPILKYGEVIGYASQEIQAGSLVHVHNVKCTRGHQQVASDDGRKES